MRHNRKAPKGQSLVELAIFFPILLLLLSGVTEFGFLLNTYLNLIDGPREAARYAEAQNPFGPAGITEDNAAFYSQVAIEAQNALLPYHLDPERDDVIISIFTVNGDVVTRYPNSAHLNGESALDETVGEWHLYGRGSDCTEGSDLDCHTSRFTDTQIRDKIMQTGGAGTPPNNGAVLVELFYSYHQVLALPWLSFISNPIRVYTYTIMPVPNIAPQ